MYDRPAAPAVDMGGLREFKWQEDMDTNGILYAIGTNGYTKPWSNPGKIAFPFLCFGWCLVALVSGVTVNSI